MNDTSVTYRNTRADLIYFNLYHGLHLRAYQVLIGGLFVAFAALVVPPILKGPGAPLAKLIAFVVILSVLAVVLAALHVLWVVLIVSGKASPSVLTEHVLTLTPGGIVEVTPVGRHEQSWSSMHRIQQTRRYFYLYTQQHGAHVVPRSAFSSAEAASGFFLEAEIRYREALGNA